MTFLGYNGGGMPAGTEGGVPPTYGTDLSQATMFGAGPGGFGAFTQPPAAPGYPGFDFHTSGYSQWGPGPGRGGGEYYRADPYAGQQVIFSECARIHTVHKSHTSQSGSSIK